MEEQQEVQNSSAEAEMGTVCTKDAGSGQGFHYSRKPDLKSKQAK